MNYAVQKRDPKTGQVYYDSPSVSIPDGQEVCIALIDVSNRQGHLRLRIQNMGEYFYTGFTIRRAMRPGGLEDYGEGIPIFDSSFTDPATDVTDMVPDFTQGIQALSGGDSGEVEVLCSGVAEIGLYVRNESGETAVAKLVRAVFELN